MATSINIAQLQTLTIKQLKAQIAEVTGQTVKSNNRPYLIGKLAKALEAKAAAEAEQARNAKKTKTTRKAATAKSTKTEKAATAKSEKAEKGTKAEKAEKAERRTRTSPRKAGERDPRLPAVGTVLEREHQGKKIRVTVLEDGFRYEGETYSSLSTIARVATGTIWNGFTFFKIAPYPKRNQAQAAA
jgi:ATPase subunit of ABC transporter with duplicated ATPase domains